MVTNCSPISKPILKWRLRNQTFIRDYYWIVTGSGRKWDCFGEVELESVPIAMLADLVEFGGWNGSLEVSWVGMREQDFHIPTLMCECKLPLKEGITLRRAVFFSQVSPQRRLMIKDHLLSAFSTAGGGGHHPSFLKSNLGGASENPQHRII